MTAVLLMFLFLVVIVGGIVFVYLDERNDLP